MPNKMKLGILSNSFTKEDAFKVAEQKGRDDMKQEILELPRMKRGKLDQSKWWRELIKEIEK